MVRLGLFLHDRAMGRRRDVKLQTIAESVVGRGCSPQQLCDLGRAGDLIDCTAGETFHAEGDATRWAYLLLDGDVALSQRGDPMAVATRGAWFPLWDGAAGGRAPLSLTALSDSRLLVFRRPDFEEVRTIPTLVRG
jgi:CRP-like cAMP-binding protein